jgi:hypothetical protein
MIPAKLLTFVSIELLLGVCLLAGAVHAQSVAILAPDGGDAGAEFAERLSERLNKNFRLVDETLARAAYSSVPLSNPFNMSVEEASRVGTVIGADVVIVVRSGSLRRSSSDRPEYYESYAAVHAYGTRTGAMIHWQLHKSEASSPAAAKRKFNEQITAAGNRAVVEITSGLKREISGEAPPGFADAAVEADKSKDFRPPVPYKRVKPAYTDLASLYDIRATVDVVVYLDEKGAIVRTDLLRSAGFGLDESVISNIRSMNWRPAEAGGKPVASKFLVRYNFKKGE